MGQTLAPRPLACLGAFLVMVLHGLALLWAPASGGRRFCLTGTARGRATLRRPCGLRFDATDVRPIPHEGRPLPAAADHVRRDLDAHRAVLNAVALQDRRRGPSQVYTARAAVGERVVQEGASAVPGHQQTIGPDPLDCVPDDLGGGSSRQRNALGALAMERVVLQHGPRPTTGDQDAVQAPAVDVVVVEPHAEGPLELNLGTAFPAKHVLLHQGLCTAACKQTNGYVVVDDITCDIDASGAALQRYSQCLFACNSVILHSSSAKIGKHYRPI
mmetsp:Transcript_106907/g.180495  ORF Transcript_106907/g.180495 Transcript_106907/m.180495 type:complete len:273 (+) Transcript_106907:953-1771(+)